MIELYNNLHRKKEEFKALSSGSVGLYTCGPTVYDYAHIGHMRAYITWDILKRFLISQGYTVNHIMNITDVGHLTSDADEGDDKMELARTRERLTAYQIAEKYFEFFKEDLNLVNVLPPTHYVKATDLITEQIAFAKVLEEKGFLYRISDGMYFDTSKDPDYGKLGHLDFAGMKSGARVEVNPEKRNPTDFAVWKFSPDDSKRDMEWDSPWGKGFPGWHLECSVISMQYLGETFDIHTGGIDHLTVHHPNEMAQSKAYSGKLQANYWLHNNFINDKNKKISKSAGTFVRLADIIAGGVNPLAYRYYVLQTHYRKELAYSWDAVKAANQGLKNLYQELSFYQEPSVETIGELIQKFDEALSDDLNTSKALDVMQQVLKAKKPSSLKLATLFKMDEVLGFGMRAEWQRRSKLPAKAKELLAERLKAREAKDWKQADILRDKLAEMGVAVMDTNEGQMAALSK